MYIYILLNDTVIIQEKGRDIGPKYVYFQDAQEWNWTQSKMIDRLRDSVYR
jgi:hypothetical protein